MYFERLSHRALLSLSGADAASFLQGLISGNAQLLEQGEALYSALLSPQGKFLHDLFLVRQGENILIDCEHARSEDLRKRLMLYKLRSKVAIEPAADLGVVAVWSDESSKFRVQNSVAKTFPDPRLPLLGYRIIGDVEKIESELLRQGLKASDYDAHRLALGVPDGSRDMIIDKSILLEWGFEDLHGIDFLKGCYVGQEVTARSKYRGQVKKNIHQVKSISGENLPLAGTPITIEDQAIGEMRSSKNGVGLAIIRAEELKQAQDKGLPLKAGEIGISAALPKWFASVA